MVNKAISFLRTVLLFEFDTLFRTYQAKANLVYPKSDLWCELKGKSDAYKHAYEIADGAFEFLEKYLNLKFEEEKPEEPKYDLGFEDPESEEAQDG